MRNTLKQCLIYCLWNLYIWGVIWLEAVIDKSIFNQLSLTKELNWIYIGSIVQVSMWLLVGLGISWLISKSIYSKRDMILEVCMIGGMGILLALAMMPFANEVLVHLRFLIHMHNSEYVTGIIIGVELFKIIKYIKYKKERK